MLVNTGDIRTRIQAEVDNHLAKAASLQEKLTLLEQIESLANDVGVEVRKPSPEVAATPEARPEAKVEGPGPAALPTEQSAQAVAQIVKEAAGNGGKNPWAFMQQGFQAYLSGKLDRALELFKEARELNPGGFEKTWTTMTSIPVYQGVARDKYFMEGLFPPK